MIDDTYSIGDRRRRKRDLRTGTPIAYCSSWACHGKPHEAKVVKNIPLGTNVCPDCRAAVKWKIPGSKKTTRVEPGKRR